MFKTHSITWLLLATLAVTMSFSSKVSAFEREPQRPAIVLAAFGTTDLGGLEAILNVENKVKAAFPGYDVHLAFTSNIIRNIWRHLAQKGGRREFPQSQ